MQVICKLGALIFRLVRQGLGPEKVGLAASAVHVVATPVLLNLAIASRAEAHKLRVLRRPSIELASSFLLLADTALLSSLASNELLTTTVRVHAKAILLSEVAAFERARTELSAHVESIDDLVESEAVELGPSDLIDKGFDLLFANDLTAVDMGALDSNILNDGHNNREAIP